MRRRGQGPPQEQSGPLPLAPACQLLDWFPGMEQRATEGLSNTYTQGVIEVVPTFARSGSQPARTWCCPSRPHIPHSPCVRPAQILTPLPTTTLPCPAFLLLVSLLRKMLSINQFECCLTHPLPTQQTNHTLSL